MKDSGTHGVRHAVALGLLTTACLLGAQTSGEPSSDLAGDANAYLSEWLGVAVPAAELPRTARPHLPWVALGPDTSADREWITTASHRYWAELTGGSIESTPFLSALAQYTGVRLAHELLRADHRPTFRFFGGIVPYVSRHVRLTLPKHDPRPPVTTFPDSRESPSRQWLVTPSRNVVALFTLERYLGWPTMQLVLMRFAADARSRGTDVDAFANAVTDVTGRDLQWFFADAMRTDKTYDYAIVRVESQPAAASTFRSVVVARRFGEAMFSGTSALPAAEFESAGPLEIVVQFADGTTLIERWDGRAIERQLTYEGPSPAVAAIIDARDVLLLDANRLNNGLRSGPPSRAVSARWSMHWLAWLQDTLLVAAAVL